MWKYTHSCKQLVILPLRDIFVLSNQRRFVRNSRRDLDRPLRAKDKMLNLCFNYFITSGKTQITVDKFNDLKPLQEERTKHNMCNESRLLLGCIG